MTEEWRESMFPNYEVSSLGNVRRIATQKAVRRYKTGSNTTWYVTLSNRSHRITCTVPRLVMEAFNEDYKTDPDSYRIVFKDGDRDNVAFNNLELVVKASSYAAKTLSYRNDIYFTMNSDRSLKKMKNTIVTIVASNKAVLYENVLITNVSKKSRYEWCFWGHEVYNRITYPHDTVTLDLRKDTLKNEFTRI